MIEEVVLKDEVPVLVSHERAIIVAAINLAPGIVDAFDLLSGEKDIVVFLLGAQRPGARVIIPLHSTSARTARWS